MPEDSYLIDYFETMSESLEVGAPVYFVIKVCSNISNLIGSYDLFRTELIIRIQITKIWCAVVLVVTRNPSHQQFSYHQQFQNIGQSLSLQCLGLMITMIGFLLNQSVVEFLMMALFATQQVIFNWHFKLVNVIIKFQIVKKFAIRAWRMTKGLLEKILIVSCQCSLMIHHLWIVPRVVRLPMVKQSIFLTQERLTNKLFCHIETILYHIYVLIVK